MTREPAALPNDGAWSDPAAPPRMVLNRQVYEVATAANRRGITVPSLPEIRHWAHHVSPLAVHLMAPALAAQGNDLARGLLLFADAKPAREDDGTGDALAAHLAECFGCGAGDHKGRVRWARDRADLWQEIAETPLAAMEWAKAPRPWSALAAAVEFAAYLDHDRIEFPSRLPVTLAASQLARAGQQLPHMGDAAAYLSAASAAAFGIAVVSFGEGLFATHASDAWLLDATCADAFRLVRNVPAASEPAPSPAPSPAPKPTLVWSAPPADRAPSSSSAAVL